MLRSVVLLAKMANGFGVFQLLLLYGFLAVSVLGPGSGTGVEGIRMQRKGKQACLFKGNPVTVRKIGDNLGPVSELTGCVCFLFRGDENVSLSLLVWSLLISISMSNGARAGEKNFEYANFGGDLRLYGCLEEFK